MEKEERVCRECGCKGNQEKRGKNKKGHVRYRCKQCKKWYILEEPRYNNEFKKRAIEMYLEGNSGRAVGRFFKIGKNTIWGWLREHEANLPKTEENDVVVAEMDELYSHIKKEK